MALCGKTRALYRMLRTKEVKMREVLQGQNLITPQSRPAAYWSLIIKALFTTAALVMLSAVVLRF